MNFYKYLALAGLALIIIGNCIGGWEEGGQNNFERFTDFVGLLSIVWGMFGDVTQNLTIQKNTIVHTDTVEAHCVNADCKSLPKPTNQ